MKTSLNVTIVDVLGGWSQDLEVTVRTLILGAVYFHTRTGEVLEKIQKSKTSHLLHIACKFKVSLIFVNSSWITSQIKI